MTDTTPDADRVRTQLLRAAGPERRLSMAMQIADGVRALCRAGIVNRHPDYDEAELEAAYRRLILGEALYKKAWPGGPEVRP